MNRMILCIAALLLSATAALAAPSQMNYQGQLFLNGSPTAGPVSIIFRMFDAQTGGTELWSETDIVTVTGGLFSTTLGDGTAFPGTLFSAQVPWLEMEVNGTVMTPRTQFASVPYALNTLATGGVELWETNGTNVWRSGGKVGIGTTTPAASLTIDALSGGSSGRARLYYDSSIYPSIYGEMYHNGDQSGLTLQARGSSVGSGDISFWTGQATPVERMRINHNGGVNIVNVLTADALASNTLVTGRLGFGPATPWTTTPGIYLDAQSQQSTIQWNNRSNTGFMLYQVAGTDRFSFASTGGGSLETWNFTSAGLGDLMTIGPAITTYRPLTVNGGVQVNGSLNVSGTKCRVVETAYGQLKMNAVESAHALFMDDEPSAHLVSGRCRVNLSPQFLATVTVNGKYPLAVNVTFYGRHGGEWYVERDATGFTVIDPSGSNAELSWQATARQRGYEDHDLEPVTQTAAKEGGRP